jgi:hypothetical protein
VSESLAPVRIVLASLARSEAKNLTGDQASERPPTSDPDSILLTLVIAPDIAEIYGASRSNVDTWRSRGFLGDPATVVSGHAVWILEHLSPLLAERLNPPRDTLRGRPPVYRAPDVAAIARVRARSAVEPGAVPAGIKEIGWCMWMDPDLLSSPAKQRQLPDPIALLGPPFKPNGKKARQDRAFDLREVAHWPEFDRRGRGAELLAARRVG